MASVRITFSLIPDKYPDLLKHLQRLAETGDRSSYICRVLQRDLQRGTETSGLSEQDLRRVLRDELSRISLDQNHAQPPEEDPELASRLDEMF
jgi:hypothetical protein